MKQPNKLTSLTPSSVDINFMFLFGTGSPLNCNYTHKRYPRLKWHYARTCFPAPKSKSLTAEATKNINCCNRYRNKILKRRQNKVTTSDKIKKLLTRTASIRKPRQADVLPLSRNYRHMSVKCEYKQCWQNNHSHVFKEKRRGFYLVIKQPSMLTARASVTL